MIATRKTQPYRKGPRNPSIVLSNIKRGRSLQGHNPMDAKRGARKRIRVVRRKKRL